MIPFRFGDESWKTLDDAGSHLTLRKVFFAHCSAKAELDQTSKLVRCNIRAPRVVADIFAEFFFAAVWSFEARLNGDPGRTRPPAEP